MFFKQIKIRKYENQLSDKNKEIKELNEKITRIDTDHKLALESDRGRHQGQIRKFETILKEKDSVIQKMEQDIYV